MAYYKDEQNNVYWYDEDQIEAGLAKEKIIMTTEEIEAHINPPKTEEEIKQANNNNILSQIATIEAKQARPLREAFSADEAIKEQAMIYIKQYDDEITALRSQLL